MNVRTRNTLLMVSASRQSILLAVHMSRESAIIVDTADRDVLLYHTAARSHEVSSCFSEFLCNVNCAHPPATYSIGTLRTLRLASQSIRAFFLPPCLQASFLEAHVSTSRAYKMLTTFPSCTELYCYLRSPYRDLSAYDNNVQVRNLYHTLHMVELFTVPPVRRASGCAPSGRSCASKTVAFTVPIKFAVSFAVSRPSIKTSSVHFPPTTAELSLYIP